MKRALFALVTVSALAATPALAQYEPPNRFDAAAHAQAYGAGGAPFAPRCFNGAKIKGVSRSGQRSLLVQNGAGMIYEVKLREDCHAVERATKLSAMSGQGSPVCEDDTAILFARTDAGLKRCKITDVRRLSSSEIAAFAGAAKR